jgi:hypothetical protein
MNVGKIRIDEDDFRKLVNGEVITLEIFPGDDSVEILMSDFGFPRMAMIVADALSKAQRLYRDR